MAAFAGNNARTHGRRHQREHHRDIVDMGAWRCPPGIERAHQSQRGRSAPNVDQVRGQGTYFTAQRSHAPHILPQIAHGVAHRHTRFCQVGTKALSTSVSPRR